MNGRFKSIRPFDLVAANGRLWSVVGVHLGAAGHENLIELQPIDREWGDGTPIMVPLDLIPAEAIFRAVDHEAAKRPHPVAA